jgi:hypothetical protein
VVPPAYFSPLVVVQARVVLSDDTTVHPRGAQEANATGIRFLWILPRPEPAPPSAPGGPSVACGCITSYGQGARTMADDATTFRRIALELFNEGKLDLIDELVSDD